MTDPIVNLDLPQPEAMRFSNAISDVLCWLTGFQAAARDEAALPPNWDALHDLNIKLKRAINLPF